MLQGGREEREMTRQPPASFFHCLLHCCLGPIYRNTNTEWDGSPPQKEAYREREQKKEKEEKGGGEFERGKKKKKKK